MSNGASKSIQERSFEFAVRIMNVVRALPHDTAGYVVGRQLGRSGTSIGANAEEARAAHSRADFAHAMNIARKEACEARYWLRLIAATSILPRDRVAPLIGEADELVGILTSTVKHARRASQVPVVERARVAVPDSPNVVGNRNLTSDF